MAVASRTKANTARTWAHDASVFEIPRNRALARNTTNTESWLTTSAASRGNQRSRTSWMVCARNRTASSPHPLEPSRPAGRWTRDARRPSAWPVFRATPSRCSMAATTPIRAAINATPRTAAPTRPASGSPFAASRASETTGRASLKDMFATKVAKADMATWALRNPHDVYMA
jgi:hypothetical protein